jgi:hypothetical protein
MTDAELRRHMQREHHVPPGDPRLANARQAHMTGHVIGIGAAHLHGDGHSRRRGFSLARHNGRARYRGH